MKSKRESEFIMFRMKRSTHNKLKKINLKESEKQNSFVPVYETLHDLVEKIEKKGGIDAVS